MTSSNVYRVRATSILANLIVVAGFMAVLPLVLRAFVPEAEATPLLALVPELPGMLPILVALGGLAVMFAGSAIASRQSRLLNADQRRREDARRRVHHYRSEKRIEPTFGAADNQ